ncbi:ANK REP REGION domain-containing protein [Citrus sinensis]|nr:ANK REP REGION domain-containing protein [Citrus sinensis]
MNPVSTHPNLFKAAAEGHADEPFKKDTRSNEIRGLLTAQAKNRIRHINIISQKSKTGSTKFMEEILEICPSVLHNCPADDENNTALHEAVCHGNVQVVKILTGQDPDYPYSANNYGKTQLYLAAKGRYSEMVIELLENSTSVSYEGPNGKTALHAAAMHFYYGGKTTYDCARQMSGLQ